MFVIPKCFRIRRSYKINVSRCFSLQSPVKSYEERRQKATHVAELLNCSVETAILLIVKNPKIMMLDDDCILKSTSFCTKNMGLSDVVENPSIVSTSHHALNRNLYALKELGCEHVRGRNIVNFDKLIKEAPKISEDLQYTREALLKNLVNCSPTEASEISSKLLQMSLKNCSSSSIKAELNIHYFMLLFQCSREKLQPLLKKNPSLLLQNIGNMNSVVKVLTEKLGFTITKIYHSPFLLTLQNSHVENILEIVPTILDVSIKTLSQKHTAVLRKSPVILQRLEVILKNFEITSKQLANCPKVLTFLPNTLRHRLQALHNSEDFSMFKSFRGFLSLVYFYNNISVRSKVLKEADIPYSLSMFIVSEPVFRNSVLMNRGQNNSRDVVQYLSKISGCNESAIRRQLSDLPKVSCTSVLNAYKVINFLLEQGVSEEQLWNGLSIIGYKHETVEKVFRNLPYFKEFQPFSEWKSHFNLIQLLIYAIQKKGKHRVSIPTDSHKLEMDKTDDSNELMKDLESNFRSEVDFESEIENEIDFEDDIENEVDDLSDSDDESLMSDAHKL